MSRPFIKVRLDHEQGAAVVRVLGEVDMATSPDLERALLEAIDSGADQLVIDLLDVGFLDSSGLSVLLRARSRIGEDRQVALVVGEGVVDMVLKTTAMGRMFRIVESLEAALDPT